MGRLVPKKGFDVLVDACSELRRRGERFRCEILGEGSERAALEHRILEAGLEGHVVLRGACSAEEVRAALGRAAALAVPSVVAEDGNRDGLPTVLVEAMALGTPCVATPVTGIPEVVVHGRSGLLVKEGDPHALADALAALLGVPELRSRVASCARDRIDRDFDVDRNVRPLLELFRESEGPE